jgi:hypothetical protein
MKTLVKKPDLLLTKIRNTGFILGNLLFATLALKLIISVVIHFLK